MRAAIVTTCTNRKARAALPHLTASAVVSATLNGFATTWRNRVGVARDRVRADHLYAGRGFSEAEEAWRRASEIAAADLLIVSAGLGLTAAADRVPPYALSASPTGKDSVFSKYPGATPGEWWRALTRRRRGLRARLAKYDIVVMALSQPYFALLADELDALPAALKKRMRLIVRTRVEDVPPGLQSMLMPYDARLNGPRTPLPGAESDFAQRALRHFVSQIWVHAPTANAADHASSVRRRMSRLRYPIRHQGARANDDEIVRVIKRHGFEGGSAKLLRILRDEENIACEQSRFARLYKAARGASGKPKKDRQETRGGSIKGRADHPRTRSSNAPGWRR